LADDLVPLMDVAGVDRVLLVPPPWDPDANAESLEAAGRWPDRFRVMGHLDVREELSRPQLETWLDQPWMAGMRLAFRAEYALLRLIDGTTDWLWGAAADAGIPVMVYPPWRLGLMAEIARTHPRLRLTIDHLGIHERTRGLALAHDLGQVVGLAAFPNVAVKVSALPLYSEQPFPHRDSHQLVATLVDAFGPERCFWGTDLTRLDCSYHDAVAMMDETPFLSAEMRELVMGQALLDWLPWI
jgi:predicted TIM-barrel fold metal-dependent hydrolase